MRKSIGIAFPFFFAFCILGAIGQTRKIDSLKGRLQRNIHDTERVSTLISLSNQYADTYPDSALKYALEATTLGRKTGWKKAMVNGERATGNYYFSQSDYPKTLQHWQKALKLDQERLRSITGSDTMEVKKDIALIIGNIGMVYHLQSDFPKALEYYLNALKLDEAYGNNYGVSRHLCNIGALYSDQLDHSKALEYYLKALRLDEAAGDKNGIAINLGNIANVYHNQNNHDKALEYLFRSLKLNEELNFREGIARDLGNIGSIYKDKGQYPKALEYCLRALKAAEASGKQREIAIQNGYIGAIYSETRQYKEAEKFLLRSVAISDTIGDLNEVMETSQALSDLYNTLGNYKSAYEHYKRSAAARDSIFNEDKSEDLGRLEAKHEFDTQEALEEAGHKKELELAGEREKRQQLVTWSVIGGLLMVLVFALFLLNRFRVTRRQKRIIEEQKALVDEKQKEIIDSITYARRIQHSLLPTEKYIDKNLSILKKSD
jgi:tetratricopeptide (TPR) repeat protein